MPHRAREIRSVRRDSTGRITHLVGVDDQGARWESSVEEATGALASREQWLYVVREGEAMLVNLIRQGGNVVIITPIHGPVQLPDK